MTKENTEKEEHKTIEKECFVIMPISDTIGYDPGHFKRVYDYLIKPSLEKAGFKPQRADDVTTANMIVVDILKKAVNYDFAICDLSSRNPNVFFELGIRQAFKNKTVLIIDEKTQLPFDIASIRTITYKSSLRIDEVKESIENISKALISTFDEDEPGTTSLLQLLAVEKPKNIGKHTLSEDSSFIMSAIESLRNDLQKYPTVGLKNTFEAQTLLLANGNAVEIDDKVWWDYKYLGKYQGVTKDKIIINNPKGQSMAYEKDIINSPHFSLIDPDNLPF